MEPTRDVLFFLRSMASANRFEKMMAILSTVDTLDDLDMDTVVESYVEDMRSYVEDSSRCKEYLDMIHHALGESKLFTYLMEADFSHNLDAGDTVKEFTSFKYLDYNRLMNETYKRIHRREQVDPILFKSIISMWAIYNLFNKGVVHDKGKKYANEVLSDLDGNFHAVLKREGILYHIRNAVAHGFVTIKDGDFTFENQRKLLVIGIKELTDGLVESIPQINFLEGWSYTYHNIMSHLEKNSFDTIESNFESACLTLLSNSERYFGHVRKFALNHCAGVDEGQLSFHEVEVYGGMSLRDLRNIFAHELRLGSDGKIIIENDGGDKDPFNMTLIQFMAFNDLMMLFDDLLILRCIGGSKDLRRKADHSK